MNVTSTCLSKYRRKIVVMLSSLLCFLSLASLSANGQTTPLRRPISPQQPMWLIHIDTWNYADPQKIIDLIPADVRPYVVFNISISISHEATGRWNQAEYGFETIKSWLRTCAENRVWAIVQQSSGGFQHFSDFDLRIYEELYRDYPNLIGFNYAEQFWGYDDPFSVTWLQRMAHFTNLLKLSNKYGGYLTVSWCGNEWSPSINPMAMMKRNPDFLAATKQFNKNFILCEKYTQQSYQSDMESLTLGAYLSGLSGHYGIRYDDTGWTDASGAHANFTMATAGAPHLEHIMLTGQTVVDGPELIWTQQTRELSAGSTSDGYLERRWELFPQFNNVTLDIFRKILDGTVRIPSRKEVIDRTKVAIIHDVNTGSNDNIYSTPATLFEGLYRMDTDGNLKDNKSFFKKTGRYPTIPTVFQLADADANSIQLKVNASTYATRWPTIQAKVNELNTIFPKEYSGDIYAGRHENGWVVYNPYKTGQTATGRIPFKYNTCDSIELSFSQYTSGVIKETANQLKIYLNNYDNMLNTGLKTDVIKIYGSTAEPVYTFADRANHQASTVTKSWMDGVLTLTIQHNGALDITVNCTGTASGRLTTYKTDPVMRPEIPAVYSGPRQYEAENSEYKSINGNVTSGVNAAIRNYTAQGYLRFGTNAAASIRRKITAPLPGTYQLETRYSASAGDVSSIDLYVNGVKIATPTFAKTSSDNDWAVNTQIVTLKAGENTIMFSANKAGTYSINFDNIVVSGSSGTRYDFQQDLASNAATVPVANLITLRSGTAGVVSYTDGASNTTKAFKAYSGGAKNGTGVADLDLFPGTADYSVTWKEFSATNGGKKGLLLRASGENGSCPYAFGMKQGYLLVSEVNTNGFVTLNTYVAGTAGISARAAFTSSFSLNANASCWYRATAMGSTLKFECSKDSVTWEGGSVATFSDESYPGGTSQLVWGMGSETFDWRMDNITFRASRLSASKVAMSGFEYIQGQGPSASQVITVSGRSLNSAALVTPPAGFEISTHPTNGYGNSVSLALMADSIAATNLYVRLKSGLIGNTYKGDILIQSDENSISVPLAGKVKAAIARLYDFETDVAGTSAGAPPATNVSVATDNGATAGVASFTDASGKTSKFLRPYSGGARNATGALNLNAFPDAADYSVVWKQANGSSSLDYKVGMLLRGNTPEGTSSSGYVQGLKQGYVFIVYNNGTASPGRSEFRIYKSTAATSLSMLANVAVNSLSPTAGQPMWYRASVTGATQPVLKLEYSTDSLSWSTGASSSDPASSFASGSTQFVWGLAAANWDSYVDNITQLEVPRPGVFNVSKDDLTDLSYIKGAGPSASGSFTVSGSSLAETVLIKAPSNFEISLDPAGTYSSDLSLIPTAGSVAATIVYARLKAGLEVKEYMGELSLTYSPSGGSTEKSVSLSGKVSQPEIYAATPSLLNDLGYVVGYTSVVRSFDVSANTLGGDLTISAGNNFEISLNSGGSFTSSIILSPTNGEVNSTTIYARLKSGLGSETFSSDVTLSSAGAVSKKVTLAGKVSQEASVSVSDLALDGLGYNYYSGNAPVKSFMVWGSPLAGNITLTAPLNYEVSLSKDNGFGTAVSLPLTNAVIDPSTVYVRLKTGLAENLYTGNISISSDKANDKLIALTGFVSWSRQYDFSMDVATVAAATGTTAALNITNGSGNTATAGVVSYTDAGQIKSNRFRAYSGGQKNATGAMNLNLFPADAGNYSVTWKQNIGSADLDYKVGVLLRGTNPAGDATNGYVQGLLNGYVFIAYTANGSANKHSEFRIYRSTTSTSLNILVNNSDNSLIPQAGQSLWYRASVAGASPVALKLEYSADSITWVTGATASDASSTPFTSGSTQLVWGLGAANYNFYLDNITFREGSGALPVSLASFTAKIQDAKSRLDWYTLSETNNSGFEIERSRNAEEFERIGFVSAKGNGTTSQRYSFTDHSPYSGINYYRLKQIDADGKFTYSEVKAVSLGFSGPSVWVYPNPVSSVLNIRHAGKKGVIQIVDAAGRLRMKSAASSSGESALNVSDLPSGVYFYRLGAESGTFVKE